MNDFKPNSNVITNELILIASKSWPKDYFREISEMDVIKEFYNVSYKNFHEEIELVLNLYHPASWVRIAYIQLELWTLVFLRGENQEELDEVIRVFPPIARYGWRYILEISLEKVNDNNIESYDEKRPSDNDVSKIFTLLLGLTFCSEISNYIHYFKDRFVGVKIIFSAQLYTKYPVVEGSTTLFANELLEYLGEDVDYSLVPELNYLNNKELLSQIDLLLNDHFGFSLNDVEIVIETLKGRVAHEIGATILIMPTDGLVFMLAEYTSMPIERIVNLMNFIFLDILNFDYEKRNYLKKSQNVRMLNFAGCKFNLNKNYRLIYEDQALIDSDIDLCNNHSIISFILLAEWKINFVERLIFGKRIDLKEINVDLKADISKIEHFFHRNIFENNVKNILQVKGLPCISLEEIHKEKLSCGEIDALSIDVINNIIYVIEAKNLSPVKDARASGQTISDHYKQKKYHSKFIRKIKWVEENLDNLSIIFDAKISKEFKIENYFVTGAPSPMKFLVDEYKVLTYYEFYNLINEKYGSN